MQCFHIDQGGFLSPVDITPESLIKIRDINLTNINRRITYHISFPDIPNQISDKFSQVGPQTEKFFQHLSESFALVSAGRC